MAHAWILVVFYAFLIVQSSQVPSTTDTQSIDQVAQTDQTSPTTNDLIAAPKVKDANNSNTPTRATIVDAKQTEKHEIQPKHKPDQANPSNDTYANAAREVEVNGSEVNDMNRMPFDDLDHSDESDVVGAQQVPISSALGLPTNLNITTVTKNDDVGEIQSGGNEDDGDPYGERFMAQGIVLDHGPLVTPAAGVKNGQISALVAGIFVLLCVIGYTALLMWRRYLENKYGNRQMLVNEEFEPGDLRHFSI